MKRVLILEDNRSTSELLACMVKKVSEQTKIYTTDKLETAYEIALTHTIDLFLIDIILDTKRPGDTSGLIFVETIRRIEKYHLTPVVFVTALEDPKLYSYEKLHCYEFIEKPFEEARVLETIRKCLSGCDRENQQRNLFFQKDRITIAIDSKDVVFIESKMHTLHLHTLEEDIEIPYTTLKKVKDQVEACGFVQCSRNTIVNIAFIKDVDLTNRYIGLKGCKDSVEIGGTYKREVKSALGII
ncbi:MAG: response regulator transcription factor [Lachnospiraceae bacterium]|nr:response regulator transcription factor [Lachnospiraceae bacterium]